MWSYPPLHASSKIDIDMSRQTTAKSILPDWQSMISPDTLPVTYVCRSYDLMMQLDRREFSTQYRIFES